MGTDIYTIVEVQDEGGAWRVPEPWCNSRHLDADLGRSYDLFALLAGVCGEPDPIIEPRGLPTDLSPLGRRFFRVPDNPWHHSTSWWTLAELDAVPVWPDVGTWWPDFLAKLRTLGPPDRVRIVFGFD